MQKSKKPKDLLNTAGSPGSTASVSSWGSPKTRPGSPYVSNSCVVGRTVSSATTPKRVGKLSVKEKRRNHEKEQDLSVFTTAHALAEHLLEKCHVQGSLRSELDRQVQRKLGISSSRSAGSSVKNTGQLTNILAKNPWDRTKEEIIEVHAELSKIHAFDKIHIPTQAEMDLCQVVTLEVHPRSGSTVFREGNEADRFFLILEGSVRLESREKGYTGTLYEGDGLGEAGLLHGHLRTETAWVEDPVQLLVLKKKDYDRKIRPLHIQAEQERIKEFRIIAALSGLEEDRLARLSAVTRERRFSIGDTIVKEGDDTLMGHYLMMVRKGTVECTIQSDDGEQVMFLWTLVPGDTIDLKHVVKLEPISYTATCSSVVDVMFVSSHEILPQKDSSTEPVLDKETVEKLVERERHVPEGDELDYYGDNQIKWGHFKNQIVSQTLFGVRWLKHNPHVPVLFNKWTNLPMRTALDKSGNQVGSSLTQHLSTAPLPAFAKGSVRSESNVLDRSFLGDRLLPKKEADKTLRKALGVDHGAGGSKHEEGFTETMWQMNSTAGIENDKVPNIYDPMHTLAGVIVPDPQRTNHIVYAFSPTFPAGDATRPPRPASPKHLGPIELDSPPKGFQIPDRHRPPSRGGGGNSRPTSPESRADAPSAVERSRRGGRPAFVPTRASNTGPFKSFCTPAPSWEMTSKRWVLKRQERPQTAPPPTMLQGTAPWHPVCRPSFGLEAATSTPIKRREERGDTGPRIDRMSSVDRLVAKLSGQMT